MSKKYLFFISFSFVLALSLASAGYGDDPIIKLDFDVADDVNAGGTSTEVGYTSFVLTDSGSEVPDVNGNPSGVIIDLSGELNDARRDEPNTLIEGVLETLEEQMYRDFIFGMGAPPSGVNITLWGLGAGRECKITIYAFDDSSEGDANRIANWTANDANLLTTEFIGGDAELWPPLWSDNAYDFNAVAYADELGRIILESTIDPCSPENEPFAYVNALVIERRGTLVPVEEAQHPQPVDGQEEVPADVVLGWIPGAYAAKHDVYLGTDINDVTDANRTNDPHGLLVSQDQVANTYNPPGLVELDQTYYWRIDEVNGLNIWPGEVWSFTTLPYFVMENFDSYEDTDALLVPDGPWKDYWDNDTGAELDLVKTGESGQRPVHDGNAIEYWFRNDYDPHYSIAEADIADLGIDGADWLSANVKSLALWFHGKEDNPVNSQMYVSLTDGDSPSETATVPYGVNDPKEDMNDIKVEEWKEWNITMQEFLDDNIDVNLANVKTITIGLGDGSGEDPGFVYFDDIIVHTTRCVLVERPNDFALVDFAPGGVVAGDCVVDNQELEEMARTWLAEDSVIPTKNPNDVNLVLYYQFEEGDGNKIYPHPSGRLNDPCIWSGTFYNSALNPPKDTVSWSTDHAPGIGGSHCAYFDGEAGTRVQCGTYGQAALGIGPHDANAITLSVWIKSLGPRTNPYLASKFMGVLGKRGGWTEDTVIWMFSITPSGEAMCFTSRSGGLYTASVLPPTWGQWTHIAATFPHPSGDPEDPNEFARLFLNGAPSNTGAFTWSNGSDPNIFLSIGNTQDQNAWTNSPEGFWGYIDEVRIYDRVLEPNEIAYLADPTPADGNLMRRIPSDAELYKEEPEGSRIVNFRDFALLVNYWLEEEMWP